MTRTLRAPWAGQSTPTNETARGANAGRIGEHKSGQADFRGAGAADQAARVIEGEALARAWLDRLHAEMAQPGELAALLAYLRGEALHGACRVIEKVLGGRHA